MARKKIIAGNWKMNMTPSEAVELVNTLKPLVANDDVDVVFCVPAIDIIPVVEAAKGSNIQIGAENMYFEEKGAFTGEISAKMLAEMGVPYVVLGHSERRQYFGETDETVNKRTKAALAHGLKPIVCVGETLEQYEAGTTKDVVKTQVVAAYKDVCPKCASRSVIAYEPVWAIGTGKTATNEIAQDVCGYIRSVVAELYGQEVADQVRIQYGGSVKPEGLKALLEQPDIDGALVGGASLVEDSYKAMIAALD